MEIDTLTKLVLVAIAAGLWVLVAALREFGLFACSAQAGASPTENDGTIRAKRIVLTDAQGIKRVILGTGKSGPHLDLFDEGGNLRLELRADGDGPSVGIYDGNERPCIVLTAPKDGTHVRLFDNNGKNRLSLAALKDGPGVWLSDGNERPRLILGAGNDAAGVALADENGKVIWSAP